MNAQIYVGLPIRAQHFVKNHILLSEPTEILKAVCDVLDVVENDVLGQSRKRPLVEARQIAIGLIAVANPKLTLKRIGLMFGSRDHSTIIYAKNTFYDLYHTDKQFTEKVNKVKQITNLF